MRNKAHQGFSVGVLQRVYRMRVGTMSGTTYCIIRFYSEHGRPKRIIKGGMTLAEVKEHCNDPSTREEGVWFDGWTEE
jgi:hypothetical protein